MIVKQVFLNVGKGVLSMTLFFFLGGGGLGFFYT